MGYINFQVGEKFPLPIRAQGDGGIFQYDNNGAMFILKLRQTDVIAVEAFRTGKIELGLFFSGGILFFLYKIDGIINGWGDCPYHVQFHEPAQRPDFAKIQEQTIHFYLVDNRLDILLAMRPVSVSDAFWQKLNATLQTQLTAPFHAPAYAEAVQRIWRAYSSDTMAANALIREDIPLDIPLPRDTV